jgi:hypothetical protein
VYLSYTHGTLVAALQRHAIAPHPWQGRLYHCVGQRCELVWESPHADPAQLALDPLLERLAPFGLPDDLLPLVNALLPQAGSEPATPSPA